MPPKRGNGNAEAQEAAEKARRKVNEKAGKKNKKGGYTQNQYILWGAISVGSIVVACLLMVVNPDRGPFDTPVIDPNLISQINRNAKTWEADKNSFFQEWTIGDVKLLEGIKLSGANTCPPSEIDVPESFNLREKYNQCFTMPLFNMGNCTASWAIATASSLSDRFCMSNPAEYKDVFLSPQNLLSCDTMQQGCKGGDMSTAWRYVQQEGLVTELCFPWQADDSVSCTEKCTGEAHYKVSSYCLIQSEDPSRRDEAIRREVFANGPVVAIIWLYDDFLVYRRGFYKPMPTSTPITDSRRQIVMHAVKIVGWGHHQGKRYWIIENSWGEDWGENGLAKIVAGDPSKREGILMEDYIVAGTPLLQKVEEATDIDASGDDMDDPDFADEDIDVDLDDGEKD
jgi:cathepsin B